MPTVFDASAPARLAPGAQTERERAHELRADALTEGWRARRQSGEKHAIEDFLFTYYPIKPSILRRWHPGVGVSIEWPENRELPTRYVRLGDGSITVDTASLLRDRARLIDFVEFLLTRTQERAARFDCFGLHEWAMVYKQDPEEIRHSAVPLRLTPAETDAVVESHRVGCSHFDAYRFFTPEAEPLNRLSLTRENQPEMEQAGCLHAGMDLYKWIAKLGPLVPGELLLDAFELARDIRTLDMQASPYDVSSYGHAAVAIETDAGKAEYVRAQRGFTERSNAMRERVLAVIAAARATDGGVRVGSA
ncbi:3-methyladenine DNA glycosylase [Mycetocola tolaasinivorans]|uniref:3-methyladenine DNA glycosylase n=1 Tax=Mycetocola tolaasinivorans TaxID=76635 RepID=A0A3L7ACE5_9MICO|nr:3-methyladenine DNA glycosylase [Mycetocola tolaasinivorans]RLP77052.1 3-methyladenine DNA glycosylase [Mycetocola tolaasinivorans]